MNNRVVAELAHLIRLAASGTAWYEFAWDKANSLALAEPSEMNELPLLLKNALISKRHGPPRKSINPRSN